MEIKKSGKPEIYKLSNKSRRAIILFLSAIALAGASFACNNYHGQYKDPSIQMTQEILQATNCHETAVSFDEQYKVANPYLTPTPIPNIGDSRYWNGNTLSNKAGTATPYGGSP